MGECLPVLALLRLLTTHPIPRCSKYAILYCVLTFNIVSRMQHYHAVIFDRVKRAR